MVCFPDFRDSPLSSRRSLRATRPPNVPLAPGETVDDLQQPGDGQITEALTALREGSPDAMDRLMPLVYDHLRRIAQRQLGGEAAGHTLSATALVHEAWLRLADQTQAQWQDRAHFYAIARDAMA